MAEEKSIGTGKKIFGIIGILATVARLIWQIVRLNRKVPVPVKEKVQP